MSDATQQSNLAVLPIETFRDLATNFMSPYYKYLTLLIDYSESKRFSEIDSLISQFYYDQCSAMSRNCRVNMFEVMPFSHYWMEGDDEDKRMDVTVLSLDLEVHVMSNGELFACHIVDKTLPEGCYAAMPMLSYATEAAAWQALVIQVIEYLQNPRVIKVDEKGRGVLLHKNIINAYGEKDIVWLDADETFGIADI